VECAYAESDVAEGVNYFSSKTVLFRNGIEEILPVGEISDYEHDRLKEMLPELNSSIEAGYDFVHKT